MATKEAVKIASEHNLNLTIPEPVWVYGEGEFSSGFYEYMKSVKDGMFVVPGSKKNKFHVVYSADCARAFFLAYEKKLKGIERILIGNKEPALMRDIFSYFITDAGLKQPLLIPKWIVYPVALILELIHTVVNIKSSPLLSRGRVNMFYDTIEYSVKKAEKLLGFKNRYSLEEGIHRTVRWYKEHNFI